MSNTSLKNFLDKISNGHYLNKMEYREHVRKPKKPLIFDKKAGDMTADDLAEFIEASKTYKKDIEKYEKDRADWLAYGKKRAEEEDRLMLLFKSDCEAYFFGEGNIPASDKQKSIIWCLACEKGQEYGIRGIFNWYEELYAFYKNMIDMANKS